MGYETGAPEMGRMESFIERVSGSLRDHRSRASFALYAFGLLTDGDRKSMEPIAVRMCECPDDAREMQRAHDRMINLVSRGSRGKLQGAGVDRPSGCSVAFPRG